MIKLFTKSFCIPIIFLTNTSAAIPAPDSVSYYIQHFTSENGLPQNSVKAIAGDRSGFIWLTTENGLVRFDGRNFRVYNKSNTAISSNRMRYMFRHEETSDLYALTDNYRLLRISEQTVVPKDRYHNIFFNYPVSPDSVLSAYRCTGLPDLFSGSWQLKAYRIPVRPAVSFVVTPDTVRFYEKQKESWKRHISHQDFWSFFTINKHLYHLDNKGTFTLIERDSLKTFRLTGDILDHSGYGNAMLKLYWNITSGDVFVYLDKRFYLLEQDNNGMLKTHLVISGFDFELNNIHSAFYDRENRRLFLGSQTRGLYIISRKPFRTLRRGKITGGDETYYSQIPYDTNTVLTNNGNLLGLSGFAGELPLLGRYNDRYSMLRDRQGNIWTKTRGYVYKLSHDGRRLLKRFAPPGEVTQLYEDLRGAIWIGTREAGLFRLNPYGKEQTPELISASMKGISYLLQETKDLLWVGTNSGLYRLNIPEGKLDSIPGTRSVYVRSLHSTRPGEIWFTTGENGLFLYKDGKLTDFPLDKNSYLAASHCILEDAAGYFWIPTNRGLFQAQKRNLLAYAAGKQEDVFYVYYGKEAGFNTNEFNGGCQPCGIVLESGYFSFPSLNGLVWFRPGEVRAELPLNDIYIDEIEIDSTVVRSVEDTLKLNSHFIRMQIFFTTPYFGNPYNLSFKYRLEGPSGSDDWLEVKGGNILSFSSLPAGTYKLTIRKQNGFNASGYTDKQLVIIIPPAFYETWWFISALLLTGLSAISLYIRSRLKSIRRKNDKLEMRIADRTVKLRRTILAQQASEDKLRQQNYMQQRLLAAITHDIKSPLQYLVMAAKALHENLPARNGNMEDDLERIYMSSSRVFHFTENLVRYMKVIMAGQKLDNGPVNVCDLINEKIEIFSEMAESKGNTIQNNVDRSISLRTNEPLLGIVVHNLLDNAVKFTRSGHIRFSDVQKDNQLKIILEDTGRGMSREIIDWCNNFAERRAGPEADYSHEGLGLTIVIELLAMIDGKLLIAKREQGTRIELVL